jgi:ribosome recycling factor
MNNKTINELFDETKQKMNGHTMLFYFHLSNLCIKADPMALLSATIKIEDKDLNLEDVASVSIPNDNQFAVRAKDTEYIMPITKGIKLEHPEFKLEEKTEKDEITGEDYVVIYYTMPEMNEERHNVCLEYIKANFDATSAKLEAIFSQGSAKVALKMTGASEENIKLAKDTLQEIYDWHTDTLKKLKEDKEKEVEDAYQAYLASEQAENKATLEKQAAEGVDSVFSISMEALAE